MKKNEITMNNAQYVEAINSNAENVLVGEIKMIKQQTEQMVLFNSIEIGSRLTKAKTIIKHGEWGNWLKERVDFSQRTANNLMAIYKEYGENGLASKSQSIANLNYTQAIELLAVPEETREKIAEENNVKDMTIKELKETIKSLNAEKAEKDSQLKRLGHDLEKFTAQMDASQKERQNLQAHITALEKQEQEAKANKEKEFQAKLAESIKAEKAKLKQLNSENKKLEEKIATFQEKQSQALEKARKAEQAKAEKELAKKEQELKKVTATLEGQLKKAEAEVKAANEKASKEAEKNKGIANIAQCTLLIEDILNKYNTVLTIIEEYGKINKTEAEKMLESLTKSLDLSQGKTKLKIVS